MAIEQANLRAFTFVQHFLEFYTELLRLRRAVEQGEHGQPGGPPGAQPSPVSAFSAYTPAMAGDPDIVAQRLQSLLEAQALLVGRRGSDFILAQYREAQYVMAAFADEIFIYEVEWRGRDMWRENPLEHRLFRTRSAGERLFENIELILAGGDRRQAELAPVYILALSLGFRGRYRSDAGGSVIRDYANRLFEFVFDRPADIHAPGRRLAPQAYEHVLAGNPVRGPRFRVSWPVVTAGIAVGFLVVSQIMWWAMTGDLAHAADLVVRAATPVLR